MPRVPLPSSTAGLNSPGATPRLKSSTVRTRPGGSMSSSRASSSIVPASALVTSRIRYSSRRIGTTFWSKIWKARRWGCRRISRPYFAYV